MIKKEDIDMNPNYKELSFVISTLMHEVKRMGKEEFLKFYVKNRLILKEKVDFLYYCFFLALIGYLDDKYKTIEPEICMSKYILNPYDYDDLKYGVDVDLVKLFNKANDSLRRRGFLFEEIEEAV